eukprot:TRINITY_DN15590_c0_g2_i3.p2 TRINITY_DN15590_c0_g2~~TRINITY_DN15590_c0_g2_i3.p2  ORF type:complete len:125 (-),score=2.24 TRINITY_DN15590_c0_g2_i3:204-524(-)
MNILLLCDQFFYHVLIFFCPKFNQYFKNLQLQSQFFGCFCENLDLQLVTFGERVFLGKLLLKILSFTLSIIVDIEVYPVDVKLYGSCELNVHKQTGLQITIYCWVY